MTSVMNPYDALYTNLKISINNAEKWANIGVLFDFVKNVMKIA